MAGKHAPPLWDRKFRNSVYNQRRNRNHYLRRVNTYYSDYEAFGRYLRKDSALGRVLRREAFRLANNWRNNIPVDSDNGSDMPLASSIRVRRKSPGGRDNDRQVYEVYTQHPSVNYYAAEYNATIKRGKQSWVRRAIEQSAKPEPKRSFPGKE